MNRKPWNWFTRLMVLLGVCLGVYVLMTLIAEGLWFSQLEFFSVFRVQLLTYLGLGLTVLVVSTLFLGGNLILAKQLRYGKTALPGVEAFRGIPWPVLLLLGAGLSAMLLLLLGHIGQEATQIWLSSSRALTTTRFLHQFDPAAIARLASQLIQGSWLLVLFAVLVLGVLLKPLSFLTVIAGLQVLGLVGVITGHWTTVLKAFYATGFHQLDPLIKRDIGFYLFTLPFWELLRFWIIALVVAAFAGVLLLYLLSADSLSQGYFPGFSQKQRRHLQVLGGMLMLTIALSFWLERYQLLYSNRGVVFGAGYTDVTVTLPLQTVFSVLALLLGILLLLQARVPDLKSQKAPAPLPYPGWLTALLGIYAVIAIGGGLGLPAIVQLLVVQPNELKQELAYIQRSIQHTRQAFNLETINSEPFKPQADLTYAQIQSNDLTIRNIRLWDTRPLLQTNQQLQQLRSYYRFPDAFSDRYQLQIKPDTTELRQVFLAARELDSAAIPPQANTWINQHLVYSHGYGFTMSPVNTAGEGGLPEYFVKDIGTTEDGGQLKTSNPLIANSIPIGSPRIYYGQLTKNYVLAPSRVPELDFPSLDENVYNHYDGKGGLALHSFWQRLLFSVYLRDWQLLFTPNLNAQTKVHFRRQIQERVQAIAPFLHYDQQPYLVVADTGDPENHLYWMIDAYTISKHYPYADPGNEPFNYIRNSVKVVVDAYHGGVSFYAVDPTEPLLQTWQRIFPDLFQPLDAMPAALRQHIRYPVDLFQIQSHRLLRYHMTNPVEFYNQEDAWQIPTEIYGSQPQPVEPYYLIMKLPTEDNEEFILLYPFTPLRRPNLSAWLAARSDDIHYGKLLLYEFPKQELVFGPEQLEARINQDPIISERISLWNRQGSRVIQGNLLVIPIEQSLLYVEPLYLQAEQNSLPTLTQVIVLYQERIVMAETLEQALKKTFQVSPASNSSERLPALPPSSQSLSPLTSP